MYRYKKVGLYPVGYGGPFLKLYEDIALAGVDDFHIGTLLLDQFAKSQGILQREVLLFGYGSRSTIVTTAMTGINDKGKRLVLCNCREHP